MQLLESVPYVLLAGNFLPSVRPLNKNVQFLKLMLSV
jgi:hypothetical protein